MSFQYIKENKFSTFVTKMIEALPVYGPVAKKNKFVFSKLESYQELRLDYDCTILPPKKIFYNTCQDLIKFKGQDCESCIDPEDKILFGVHFYDIKGLDMTDQLFSDNFADNNYLAHRRSTTIVGSNIQTISPKAFWNSVGNQEIKPKGHDAFLTKIKNGYVFEVITKKGEQLLKFGAFGKASDAQVKEAETINETIVNVWPKKIPYDSKEIASKVRASFSNEDLWTTLAESCFSCGSCNIVCPTCYCFDVQDIWNLDQVSGTRVRCWDACLTKDFAQISLGAGNTENFREEPYQRFRHRIMRKASYLNEKLNNPACVGCGRCAWACVPDIADPVTVINTIMES